MIACFRRIFGKQKQSRRGFNFGYLFSWQGQIRVIGDKHSEETVRLFAAQKRIFMATQTKLQKVFNGYVKTIVVVRDPYNTILRKCKLALNSSPREMYGTLNNKTLDVIPGNLKARMEDYMKWMSSVDEIMKNDLFNVKLIHLEAMFKDPEPTVREWCQWLNIECFPEYISLVKNTTKSLGNSDKFAYYWPRKSIKTINKFIENHSHLYLDVGKSFEIAFDYFNETTKFKGSRKLV